MLVQYSHAGLLVVSVALTRLIEMLAAELQPLVESGRNWQVTIHGGRNGHVKLEILRVDEMELYEQRAVKSK